MLFKQSGITTVFEQLEGFPKSGIGGENPAASPKFAAGNNFQAAFVQEYAEYPGMSTCVEIVKAVKVRSAFEMLDQMQ